MRQIKAEAERIEAEKIENDSWNQIALESYQSGIKRFKGAESFWNFYAVEQICFSDAEGGCWYDCYEPVSCFPRSKFRTVEEAKEFGRKEFGLTFSGDMIERSDGSLRPANGIHSCRAEVDGDCSLESFPFESMTFETPHYE